MKPTDLPDCLYYLVTRSAMVATSLLKQALAAAGVGEVKPAFLGVLQVLWREDGLQAAEVARRAALEPSTTTGLLDKLESLGLVARVPDPRDRRALRIQLTAAGRALERPVRRVVDQVMREVAGGIPTSDLAALQRSLKTFLTQHLEGDAAAQATDAPSRRTKETDR